MKNYLFIGGSYGIGLATVQEVSEIANVFVASRTFNNSINAKHITFDAQNSVLNLDDLPEIIDGFVYFPGTINLKPFRGLKIESFREDMELNFFAMVTVLQQIMPRLLLSPNPSVVLFSSVAASKGMPFHSSIAASKAAVEGFAKSIAAEYAPKLRINVVAPSLTDTPLANKFLNSEIKKEKAAERNPLKKVGTSSEIAKTVAFLLSENSSWITGQTIAVDGGISNLLI